MLVVTLPVPTREVHDLSVRIEGTVAHVLGPDGFCRDVNLPESADGGRLQAGLFADILELRAPRAARSPVLRQGEIEVRPLG
jgi:hypothetical protein